MIVGSGNRISVERQLAEFSRLKITVSATIQIRIGEPQVFTMEIDDNIASTITTNSDDQTLIISSEDYFTSDSGLNINIQTNRLESLKTFGRTKAEIIGLHDTDFAVFADGTAQIKAIGDVRRGELNIAGAGAALDFSDLVARDMIVRINGASNGEVNVTDSLHVVINGVGNVRFRGNPQSIEKVINGIGSVSPS